MWLPIPREYNTYRLKVGKQAQSNTELQIEYEKILDRVRQARESVIHTADRHFTAPVEEIAGTVDSISPGGFTLKQFPGRRFQFSSIGLSAADMSARILGEHNNLIRSEVAQEVDRRRGALRQYLTDNLSGDVRLVVPKDAAENAENIRAVVLANGLNFNQALIDEGYGQFREELGGAEAQAMYGSAARAFGKVTEALAFQGDSSFLNPNRYLLNSFQTRSLRPAENQKLARGWARGLPALCLRLPAAQELRSSPNLSLCPAGH